MNIEQSSSFNPIILERNALSISKYYLFDYLFNFESTITFSDPPFRHVCTISRDLTNPRPHDLLIQQIRYNFYGAPMKINGRLQFTCRHFAIAIKSFVI